MHKIFSRVGILFIFCGIISVSANAYSPAPIPDLEYTDLHRAAEYCDTEKERAELDALPRADRNTEINRVDREGYTPLAYAAQKGCVEIVKLLVESGAVVDATDANMRWTPLLRAAENQRVEVVEYLLKHSADANHKAGYLGQTPLTEAVLGSYFGESSEKGRRETVRLLLEAGADVNLPGRSGWTPLITAVFSGDAELVRLLISKSASLSVKDEKGKTALEYAQERNETEIVGILLMSGPVPSSQGSLY